MKPIWRIAVFFTALVFIYLLFPILIVPSSLPAIQEMIAEPVGDNLGIYQLEPERLPTLGDKIKILRRMHRQGIAIIRAQLP